MKQITQRLRDGRVEVYEVPMPDLEPDGVQVRVRASVVSAGTERTKVQTARQGLIGKARARPDQVRQVLDKAQRGGVRETIHAVRRRLDQPASLGYSAAGVVLGVGERIRGIVAGDRVACGGETAGHAEVLHVPGNLCVKLPADVEFAHGAFATLGSIAMQGVRQADVRLGERVAVIGLGLVGQLTAQVARAAGCSVVGVDLSADLVDVAVRTGAAAHGFVREALGRGELPTAASGCDAVIITASTASDDPIELAAHLCRDRGRVVVVGAVGMTLPRPPFYGKELELRLSRSYGPGRYDREYEARGLDYPIGYVRWTERRNMQSFVDMVGAGRIEVGDLISARVPIAEAPGAYDQLASGTGSPLGIVLEYPDDAAIGRAKETPATVATLAVPGPQPVGSRAGLAVGVIGAGSFAQRILIPAFKRAGFELVSVASQTGLSASGAAEVHGFRRAVAPSELLTDPEVPVVVIATRHASHAPLTLQALKGGRAVFVEKPPCLSHEELSELRSVRDRASLPFAVGFNRRYAPLVQTLRDRFALRTTPADVVIRVNAGMLPADHWLNDVSEGGGRLVGEGCHFVDLACWLIGALPTKVSCAASAAIPEFAAESQRFSISLSFADGSQATIAYLPDGSTRAGKELIEMHAGGSSGILDDFATLSLFGSGRTTRRRSRGRDKGHDAHVAHFAALLRGDELPASLDPLDTMAVTLTALDALRAGQTLEFRACSSPSP